MCQYQEEIWYKNTEKSASSDVLLCSLITVENCTFQLWIHSSWINICGAPRHVTHHNKLLLHSCIATDKSWISLSMDRNSSQWSTKNTSAHHPLRLEEYIYSAHTIQHLIIKQTWVLCNNYYICLKIKFLQYIFMIFRNNFYRYLNIIYRYVPAKWQ